ncbi:MAG: InlB B-repeat-containing protein [Treponema sp.]|nr:InlB B-repeat-containing protein [Treponema sp.]
MNSDGRVTLPFLGAEANLRPNEAYDPFESFGAESIENWTFSGWSEGRESGAVYPVYLEGSRFPPEEAEGIKADKTLYAVWFLDFDGNFSEIIFNWQAPGDDWLPADKATSRFRAPLGRDMALHGAAIDRPGWVMLGWDTRHDAFGPQFAPGQIISPDISGGAINLTLYAIWDQVHRVEFRANGGAGTGLTAGATSVSYDVRGRIGREAPNALFSPPQHHVFMGWHGDPDVDPAPDRGFDLDFPRGESGFTEIMPTGDIVLHAIWYREKFTVKFEPGDFGEGAIEDLVGLRGEAATLPGRNAGIYHKEEGYNLSGWLDKADLSRPPFPLGADAFVFSENITLVPLWYQGEPEPINFVFSSNFRSEDEQDFIVEREGLRGVPFVLTDVNALFDREWHDLLGWSNNAESLEPEWPRDQAITVPRAWNSEDPFEVHAVWKRQTGLVYFEANGSGERTFHLEGSRGMFLPELPDEHSFTRNSRILFGWSETAREDIIGDTNAFVDGVGGFYATGSGGFLVTEESAVLYALWQWPVYEVVFDANGGNFGGGETDARRFVSGQWGQTIEAHPGTGLARRYWEPVGWSWSDAPGATVDVGFENSHITVIGPGLRLYAVWEKPIDRLSFDANGGEAPDDGLEMDAPRGSQVTLLDGAGFHREDRELVGWSRDKGAAAAGIDGEDGFYALGSEKFVLDGDTTLYALWRWPDITLTFRANFPEGFDNSGAAPAAYTGKKGTAFTVSDDHGMNVADHAFVGWSAVAEGGNVVGVGDRWVLRESRDLYAVWVDTTVNSITITGPNEARRGETAPLTAVIHGNGVKASDLVWRTRHGGVITGSGLNVTLHVALSDLGEGADASILGSRGRIAVYAEHRTNKDIVSEPFEIEIFGIRQAGEWRLVRIGQDNTFGITWDDKLYGWGRNDTAQLGVSTSPLTFASLPVQIGVDEDWIDVAGSLHHTLGIRGFGRPEGQTEGGSLWAWGRRSYGALGIGGTVGNQATPIQVGAFTDWISIAAGGNDTIGVSYGIRATGELYAWGSANNGLLGDGRTLGEQTTPRLVGTDSQKGRDDWLFRSVAAASSHAVAITRTGELWTWGSNAGGALGLPAITTRNAWPVQVKHPDEAAGRYWASASAGLEFTVAIDDQGVAWTWGSGEFGKLGRTDGVNRSNAVGANPTPGRLEGTWRSVSAGVHNALAIAEDGRLWSWGDNERGQTTGNMATGYTIDIPEPFNPTGVKEGEDDEDDIVWGNHKWISVSAGGWFSLAVREDGALWGWGVNDWGQLGLEVFTTRPAQGSNQTKATRVLRPNGAK